MSYQSLGIVTPIITTSLESKLNPNTCYLSNCGEVLTLCRPQFSHLRNNNDLFNNNICNMPGIEILQNIILMCMPAYSVVSNSL